MLCRGHNTPLLGLCARIVTRGGCAVGEHSTLDPATRVGCTAACHAIVSDAATAATVRVGQSVKLRTRSDCRLNIGRYPAFAYDAASGRSDGTVTAVDGARASVTFDVATLTIPDLNWRSARILGVPLPPPLNIAILPQTLEVRPPLRNEATARA